MQLPTIVHGITFETPVVLYIHVYWYCKSHMK